MFGRKKIAIYTLKNRLIEKEKHIEKLECEIVSLRKEIEKVKTLNLRFSKGSETLDEIIKVQRSPLVKTGLGYIGESSQSSAPSYLNTIKASHQHFVTRQKNKEISQVKHDHFNSNKRNINQQVNINKRAMIAEISSLMDNVSHVIILVIKLLNVLHTKPS